ncbi:MAG: CarD family transcriptional regulator [Acidiferrobacterales bacterium]
MSKKAKLKVGDCVFYPSAGVGAVEAIEDVFIAGTVDPCFVIRIKESGMVVKVPQANVKNSGIRPLLSTRRIKELFRILESECALRVTGGNWTERCKDLDRRINGDSCMELAEVVRDLMSWKMQSGLSFEESMLLETGSTYLSHELAAVREIEPETAYDEIVKHVSKGVQSKAVA